SGDKRSDRDGDDRGHDEGECGGDVDGDSGDEDGNGGFSGNCSYNAFSGGNKKGNVRMLDYVGGDIEKRDDDNDGDNYGECSGDRVDCDIGGKCGNVRNEGNDDGGDKGGDVENIGNDGDGDHDVDRDVGNDDGSYIDGDSGNSSGQVSSISIDDKVTLSNFKDWLGGPDGGRKDEKCARQCMRQVEMVMKFITPNAPSISSLLSKSLLRDKWLRIIEEEKKPGTVKSYLGSLNQFFIYMRTECSARFDEMNVNEGKLVSLSEQVKLWARSSRKMAQNRFWEKRVEDFETLKTPEEVKQFDISEVARKAVKVLGEFQTDPDVSVVSQAEYTIVRDYLMTLICINNGSRSGPIANMTMEEFQNATQQDDCYVVRVKKHKTFTTHGPAHLVLSSSIHNYMKVFIEKLRRCIPDVNACQPIVFLSYRGTPLDSSQVGAQIGSCWGKVFGKKASMGGATSFRKAAVSAVHECNEEMRGDLADLMVHNKTTADKYYLLKNKGKSAVKTSKELSRIMRDGSEKTESSDGVEKEENKDQEPPEKDAATSSVVSCPRHKWSSEETDLLKQLFATQIQMKKVSMEDIRELCKGQQFLEKIPPSKIRDKVRTLFKLGESSLPPQEKESTEEKLKRFGMPIASACKEKGSKDTKERPSEDNEEEESREDGEEESSQYSRPSSSSDVVPPSSRSRGGQDRLFSDMEMVEFRKLFSAVIHSDKPITTKVAVSMLKKNKV
ncbi:uncharacterized protein LOC114544058, partial [Dendronephthya gigantea]|uniref:uncharacterized protein LOC114544055 n=1 Tax=Dendronephthya gigantea TaxID=151771 RepID=UPI001068F01F